jgi:hypothetical protein
VSTISLLGCSTSEALVKGPTDEEHVNLQLLLGQGSMWVEEMTVLPTGRNHQKEITADKIRRVGGKGLKLQVCWCRNGTKLLIVSVQE